MQGEQEDEIDWPQWLGGGPAAVQASMRVEGLPFRRYRTEPMAGDLAGCTSKVRYALVMATEPKGAKELRYLSGFDAQQISSALAKMMAAGLVECVRDEPGPGDVVGRADRWSERYKYRWIKPAGEAK